MTTDVSALSDEELDNLIGSLNPDRTQGAPSAERAAASFKSTPEGRLNYFKSAFGADNVRVSDKDEIVWKNTKTGKWHPVDEPGFSIADVADFAGDVPEIAGSMAGGALGGRGGPQGTVAGVAGGAMLGNVLKQLIGSTMVPGQEDMSVMGRGGEALKSGILAGGIQKGFQLGGKLISRMRGAPGEVGDKLAGILTKDVNPELRDARLALEKEVGGQLLPSQITGSKNQAITEGFVSRNPFAASQISSFVLNKQMMPATRRAESLMEKLVQGGEGASSEELGAALKTNMQKVIEDAWKVTEEQASKDFGFLGAAGAKAPNIPLTNYRNGLNEIISRFGPKEFGPEANRIAAEAAKTLEGLGAEGVTSPRKLQDLLMFLGRSAYGRAPSIFKDVPANFNREVANDLHHLLRADLNAAADSAGEGNFANLLRQARKNYETNLGKVKESQNSLLSRYLGRSPDQIDPASISQWLLKQQPSTISGTLQMLEGANPQLANQVRAHVLHEAISAGKTTAEKDTAKYGVAEGRFALDAFLKALPDQGRRAAIFGDSAMRGPVENLLKFSELATAKSSSGSIQQPGFKQLMALGKNPMNMLRLVETFGAKGAAKVLTDPHLRQVLLGFPRRAAQEGAQSISPSTIERAALPLIYETLGNKQDNEVK